MTKAGTPSRRQILEGHRRQQLKRGMSKEKVAEKFKELEPIKLEPNTEYLLEAFDALSETRPIGMEGPRPISYSELKAYVELSGIELSPWEVETIKAMDRAFLAACRDLNKEH